MKCGQRLGGLFGLVTVGLPIGQISSSSRLNMIKSFTRSKVRGGKREERGELDV